MSGLSEQVFALHDFKQEHEDEITFYAGESITVIEKDEKYHDGWWQGRNQRGQVGLFPMHYISPLGPNHSSKVDLSPGQQSNSCRGLASSTSSYSYLTPESPALFQEGHNASTLTNQHPELWDIARVCAWLESVGLENVISGFIEQEITGDVLLDLNMDTLKEMGIAAYGRRYKIMTAISKLAANQPVQPPTIPSKKDTNMDAMVKDPLDTNDVSPALKESASTSSLQRHNHNYTPAVLINRLLSSYTIDDFYYPCLKRTHMSSPSPSSSLSSLTAGASSVYKCHRKAPVPPLSMSSSNSSRTYSSSLRRPASNTSLLSSFNSISRYSTRDTTLSSAGTVTSACHPTPSGLGPQKEFNNDAAHPSTSFSAPTRNSNVHTSRPETFMQKLSAKIIHLDDQKLLRASIDTVIQRQSISEQQAPECEGWLHKRSDKYKTWNKRWFVLKGTNLFYFKSPKDVRMKGIINLRGYKIMVDESIHGNKYYFKAKHEQERTFLFCADTMEAMKSWVLGLMKATIIRDYKSKVMTSSHIATVPLDVAQRMRPRPPSVIMCKVPPITTLPPSTTNEPMQRVDEDDESLTSDTQHTSIDKPNDSTQTLTSFSNNSSEEKNEDHKGSMETYQTACSPTHAYRRPSLLMMVPATDDKTTERTHAHYLLWINQYLPADKQVVDLSGAFRDGNTLITLLETLSGKTVRRTPDQKGNDGSVRMKLLDNIVAAFKFMGREGVVVDGRYTIKDIYGGHEEKIFDMIDAIRMWAETNGYTEDYYPTDTTSSQSTAMLPETPTSHEDFLLFYDNAVPHTA